MTIRQIAIVPALLLSLAAAACAPVLQSGDLVEGRHVSLVGSPPAAPVVAVTAR